MKKTYQPDMREEFNAGRALKTFATLAGISGAALAFALAKGDRYDQKLQGYQSTEEHVVAPHETYWDLAKGFKQRYPERLKDVDIRDLAWHVLPEMNKDSDSQTIAGEKILLPVYSK